jgi:hypothetical protein
MGSLTPAGAWQAIAVAVALIIGGFTMMATGTQPAWFKWVALSAVGVGFVLAMVAMALLWRTQRKRQHASIVIGDLIALGDIAWRANNDSILTTQRSNDAVVELWRSLVGTWLGRSPFRAGTGDAVLTQEGDRITDPLHRLRSLHIHIGNAIE